MHFEKVTNLHKDTILEWFAKDHVKEFYYGDGLKNTLNNLDLFCQGINNNGRYTFYQWIAFDDKIPFGFLITSPITGPYDKNHDYNKWYIEGKKTFTLDLLIGEDDYLGKGLAHRMIHVYEKAGFTKVGDFIPDFNPKPHIMMRMIVEELRK